MAWLGNGGVKSSRLFRAFLALAVHFHIGWNFYWNRSFGWILDLIPLDKVDLPPPGLGSIPKYLPLLESVSLLFSFLL